MHLNDNIHGDLSAISKITLFQALEGNRTCNPANYVRLYDAPLSTADV